MVFNAQQSFQKWQLLVTTSSPFARMLRRSARGAARSRAASDGLATSRDPLLNPYHFQSPFLEKKKKEREKLQVEKERNKKIIYMVLLQQCNVLSKW